MFCVCKYNDDRVHRGSVCACMGVLAVACVIGRFILRAALNHCFQSLLPWQQEDYEIRPKYSHINLHLKENCPTPRLCLCVRALQPHKPDVKYDVYPIWLWIGLEMHHGWSGDSVSVCCKHYKSCSSLTDYWSVLKINADNILRLSSSLLLSPFESFPHVCAREHKPDNHENKRKRQREGRVQTLVSIRWRPGHCSPNGKIQHTLMTETCCCLHTSTGMLMCKMS